jgi:hypothetical protein
MAHAIISVSPILGPRPKRAQAAPKTRPSRAQNAPKPRPSRAENPPRTRPERYVSRRSAAHLVSWCRVDSWSLRSTEDTWLSTVLTEMYSSRAISLYV